MRIKNLNSSSILLICSMFFTGASGMIIQNILSVTSSAILGNTFVQFAVTIATMLGAMAIGGILQKKITKNLLRAFTFTEVGLFLLTMASPIILYASYAYVPNHFALIQYTIIISVGILIGLEIPLISRINDEYQPDLKENIGNIFASDYVGSMIGGLIWAYFIVGKVEIGMAAYLTGALNLFVAAITLLHFSRKNSKYNKLEWVFIAVSIIGASFLYLNKDFIIGSSQQKLYEEPIVFMETTEYQNLVVTHDKEIDDYRLFINGNLQFSSMDEKIYHEFLVDIPMRMSDSRKKVLVLGGGDGLALREILEYEDVESVKLVDLDKEMIRLFKEDPILSELNGGSFKDSRVNTKEMGVKDTGLISRVLVEDGKGKKEKIAEVNVFTLDAFNFIKDDPNIYDVIIIDFPDPNHVELSKLYSLEFFIFLKKRISEGGFISIQSTSPYHAKEAFWCIGRTMERAGFNILPYHYNVPSFGDWGWFLASKEERAENISKKLDRTNFDSGTSYITSDLVESSTNFGKPLYKVDNNRINTILDPVLLDLYVEKSWKVE